MAKILVVDDEKNVRGSIRMILNDANHEIMQAKNGIEADKLLAQNKFNLVITDIIMPDKEGIELIIGINKNFPEVKIIAMTGGRGVFNPRINLKAACLLGADDTLMKPFKPDALLQSVENCLSGKTKRRERHKF